MGDLRIDTINAQWWMQSNGGWIALAAEDVNVRIDRLARGLFVEDHELEIRKHAEWDARPKKERAAHFERVTNVMLKELAPEAWEKYRVRAGRYARLLGL